MKKFIVNYDLEISRKVLAENKEEAIKKAKEPAIPPHFWHNGLKPIGTHNFEVFREND